jgi:hypothetical protein
MKEVNQGDIKEVNQGDIRDINSKWSNETYLRLLVYTIVCEQVNCQRNEGFKSNLM